MTLDQLLILDNIVPAPSVIPAPEPDARPKRSRQPRLTTEPAVIAAPQPVPAPANDEPEAPIHDALAADTVALAETLSLRLARSLGLPTDVAPDASQFTQALERDHASLMKARANLGTWASALDERERALDARERAVSGREVEAASLARLAGLLPPAPNVAKRRGILGFFGGR